jgi:hypothetical protein
MVPQPFSQSSLCTCSYTSSALGSNYSQLVKQFQQSPHKWGLICALMYNGLEKSHVGTIVELIPTLIHMVLFLFLTGLVVFLHKINLPIAYLLLSIFIICFTLYIVATTFSLILPKSTYTHLYHQHLGIQFAWFLGLTRV